MALTELKRRILAIRDRRFHQLRRDFPGQSIRWSRFQARTWADAELKRKRDELVKQGQSVQEAQG